MTETAYEAFKKYIIIDPDGDMAPVMEAKAALKMRRRLEKKGFSFAFLAQGEDKSKEIKSGLSKLFDRKKPDKSLVYVVTCTVSGAEAAREQGLESVGLAGYMEDMEELMEAHADYIVLSLSELYDFLMRETHEYDEGRISLPGGKAGGRIGIKAFAAIVGSFLVFILLRTGTGLLFTSLFSTFGSYLPEGLLSFLYRGNENNFSSAFYQGNIGTVIGGLEYLIAAVPMVFVAIKLIRRTDRDTRHANMVRKPVYLYILGVVFVAAFTLATQTAAIKVQAAAASESYRQVAQSQYSCHIAIGIVVYCLIGPVAEELLFRGIIYTTLRRYTYVLMAVIASAVVFGIYHGNIVQGIYAFIFGCIAALAYEYYGSFLAPLAVHVVQNLIAYVGSYTLLKNEMIVSWPFIIIMTVVFSGSIFALIIFKDK